MRYFAIAFIIIIISKNGLSFNIESERNYGSVDDQIDLTILSSTDIEIFDPVISVFSKKYPDMGIKYIVASSSDIYKEINSGSETYDMVMSSAMDLQMKLANDGLVEVFESAITENVPEWGVWQNKVYGFAIEPIVIVISREKFSSLPIPSNRRDFLSILRSNPLHFKDSLITYDINKSGAGYLFATQDERQTDTFWRLSEIMGGLGTDLVCCSGEMLNAIEKGEKSAAYNVVGSYAALRAKKNKNLLLIYPNDYTHVLLRTALIPLKSKNKRNAGIFLDFVLSKEGQKIIEENAGLPSLGNKKISKMLNAKPIRLNTGLLIYLDRLKRKNFLSEWNAAFIR